MFKISELKNTSMSHGTQALPAIKIGNLTMDGREPIFILGPCVLETEDFAWSMARALHSIAQELGLRFIFKASYDKANRTSVSSYRGLGINEGCRILGEIGRQLGVPVTTDVHAPEEAEIAAEHIDVLQIPAFLCRQTDLILAAAKTGRVVNVKKGQFLAPWDLKNIAQKIQAAGNERFFFTERGTSFGYNTLVADMRSLPWVREAGYRMIFDATHSVQRPGGLGGTSGGDGKLAPVLARAAVAAGCDGVFMETHIDPAKALSDGPNQVPLAKLKSVLQNLLEIHRIVRDLPLPSDSF
jgi:2-dehydro-3-deoxyphosphooctonate aldolase (KDO 8-P synthase)